MLEGLITSMTISSFEVWVSLGCTVEEQKFLQPVHVTVEIHPSSSASGLVTDRLDQVIDYVELTSIIKKVSSSKSFHLIEHLNYLIIEQVSSNLKIKKIKGNLKVCSKKIRVPVENLRDGVLFSCEMKL